MPKFDQVPKEQTEQVKPKVTQAGRVIDGKTELKPREIQADYLVVTDKDGNRVGFLPYPTEFCDDPIASHGPPTFFRTPDARLWVHAGCGLPTRTWWQGHFDKFVIMDDGQEPPWQQ